jgi:hypothetical protein
MAADILEWHSDVYPKQALYIRAGTSSTGYAVWSCKGEGGSTQCKFRISAKWLNGLHGALKISHASSSGSRDNFDPANALATDGDSAQQGMSCSRKFQAWLYYDCRSEASSI